MNFMNRAWLYIVRKRGKSILLFVILLVMATFVLTALALGNASKAAQQELRQSLGGSFLIGFDYTENNPYLKVESVEGGTLMYSTQQIDLSPLRRLCVRAWGDGAVPRLPASQSCLQRSH